MTRHTYRSTVAWAGRTTSYDSYDRQHEVTLSGVTVPLSADAAFRGNSALPNPEQLLVAAASSCQLLSFLAVAALAGVEVVEYSDEAEGVMPDDQRPLRLTGIALRPRIVVRGATVQRVERLVHKAHQQCFIANSLATDITIEPVIEVL